MLDAPALGWWAPAVRRACCRQGPVADGPPGTSAPARLQSSAPGKPGPDPEPDVRRCRHAGDGIAHCIDPSNTFAKVCGDHAASASCGGMQYTWACSRQDAHDGGQRGGLRVAQQGPQQCTLHDQLRLILLAGQAPREAALQLVTMHQSEKCGLTARLLSVLGRLRCMPTVAG